ncbi:MAG: hypothetical protein ACFCUU_08050 [Cyclobacteriaceae bacterium]
MSIIWLLITGTVSYSGYFKNTSDTPPRFLFVILASVVMTIFFYKKANKNNLNTRFLLAIHILRVPVEVILYQLYLQKKVPILMTFKAWNFDIMVGISALILIAFLFIVERQISRIFMFWWNVIGLVFLVFIVAIAILSAPLPIQQLAFDQPNIAVLEFPFIYLPAYIVPVVFLSHILLLRSLPQIRDIEGN